MNFTMIKSVILLFLLAILYFVGTALGYSLLFEPSEGIFNSLIYDGEITATLLTLELSLQHFIIALIASIPVCLIMIKNYKVYVYLLTAIIALPVAFIGVIGIWNVDGISNILTIFKDMIIIILTPLMVTWILRRFTISRFQS